MTDRAQIKEAAAHADPVDMDHRCDSCIRGVATSGTTMPIGSRVVQT